MHTKYTVTSNLGIYFREFKVILILGSYIQAVNVTLTKDGTLTLRLKKVSYFILEFTF